LGAILSYYNIFRFFFKFVSRRSGFFSAEARLIFIRGGIILSANTAAKEDFMIVVNTETIPGMRIVELKGLVQGNTVRAKHMGRDIAASFKNLVGGELKGYTELLVEARREALARMIAQAKELQANAVVNVRFATSSITAGAAELYAYGTAVVAVAEPGE